MSLMPSIINGASMGAIYGLIAMGLTLIFGTMRVTNFAHGAMLMLSMITGYSLWAVTNINPYLLIVVIGPLMFFLGYATQMLLIRPVLKAESDKMTLLAFCCSPRAFYRARELGSVIFGADYRMAQTSFSSKTFTFGATSLSARCLYV